MCAGEKIGHESLSIFVHYVPNLLSVLDPASAVFISRKGNENMPAASTTKKQHAGAVFLNVVDPTGFEPAASSVQMRRSTK